MEIKVESEEFYYLKKRLDEAKEEIRNLEKQISELDQNELKKKVLRNSFRLADLYMQGLFKKLGFDDTPDYSSAIIDHENVSHWLGDKWYINERLKVDVHVRISNKFKTAFIELGLNENTLKPKEEDNILQ